MCHPILKDSRLWIFILQIDVDLARETREANCPFCGAALHRADYPRKPRGGPDDLPPDYRSRFSFCCSADGCRRRATPPSVRFLGTKIYLKALVILLTAMRQGPTPVGARVLQQMFGASRKTLKRWQAWWQEIFPRTPFWKSARARFIRATEIKVFPWLLLEAFSAQSSLEKFLKLLRFLSPITTRLGLMRQAP